MINRTLNLLYPSTQPKSKIEAFLDWVILWGRIVMLATAGFIALVFGVRIYFDSERNNLEYDLEGTLSLLESMQGREAYYIKVQKLLHELKLVKSNKNNISAAYSYLLDYMNKYDLKVVSLSISPDDALIEATFLSLHEVEDVENEIRQDMSLRKIDMWNELNVSLSGGEDGRFTVVFNLTNNK